MAILLAVGSSNPIAIKYALNLGWPPFLLGTLRMGLIALFFGMWAWSLRENPFGSEPESRRPIILACLCKGVGVVFFYMALWLIPANRVVMLSTFSPIISLLLIHMILEKDPVRRHHLFGVGISFIGITAILGLRETGEGTTFSFYGETFLGDMAMLLSVVFHNAMVVFEKKATESGGNPRQLVTSSMAVSVLVFLLFFLWSAEAPDQVPLTLPSLGAFVYLVTIAGILLFYYRRWLVSKLKVSYINSFSHLGKAVSILYAFLFLGESISLVSLGGFGIILLGTFIATLGERGREINYSVN